MARIRIGSVFYDLLDPDPYYYMYPDLPNVCSFFFTESPDVNHVFYHLDLDPVCNIRQDLDPDPYIIII